MQLGLELSHFTYKYIYFEPCRSKTLKEINWSFLDGYHDPPKAYNSFIKKYSESYNVCYLEN